MKKLAYKPEMEIKGTAVSGGIAIGTACVVRKNRVTSSGILLQSDGDVSLEIDKFDKAVEAAVKEVEAIKNDNGLDLDMEASEILETHIEFLRDPQIKEDVVEMITTNRRNAVDAVIQVVDRAVLVFKNMQDEYLRSRAADVQDVGDRILNKLNPAPLIGMESFQPDTILIADEISPSDAIVLDLRRIIGLATRLGGKTSHTAILAKSKNIPAVLGCENGFNKIDDNDVVIVDGTLGKVIINPNENRLDDYKLKKEVYDQHVRFISSLRDISATTSDGVKIKLLANISHAEDMEDAFKYGAEGAGLFRTEVLFMNRENFPSEEEQFELYKKVALKSKMKPVIVRTLDIGGDKPLDYFKFPREENPFLGYRAIRICLDRRDIFLTQLKAILRASVFGDFRIMFPMISNVQELRLAKTILEEAKMDLKERNFAFADGIPVGMMIEVPSAAITADILAKEVDFFSIGTNDLCQYTLAVDRGNEKIKDLYDPYNPALLRLIKYVIEQGHRQKIDVGMCGELASDPQSTLLLLGMGLTEFSMSPASVPAIKNVLINHSYAEAKELCERVMAMDNSNSIITYLQK